METGLCAVLDLFDYSFPQNGLQYYKGRDLVTSTSLSDRISDEKATAFVSHVLRRIADLDIPVKTGTFVERRTGMFNVSPVGRNCSQKQRDEFEAYDHVHHVRKTLIADLEATFPELGLQYSIGGQISTVSPGQKGGWGDGGTDGGLGRGKDLGFEARNVPRAGFDVFPKGWTKQFALQYVEAEGFTDIHFFGDKTFPGGNDYEIYTDPRVKGHTTDGPEATMRLCRELFLAGDKKPSE
jgi:phosphomannomutase